MPTLTIELALAVVTIGQYRAIAAAMALAAQLLVLTASRKAVRDTTLNSAWWWSLAALASWGGVALGHVPEATAASSTTSSLELAALTLSLCPAISLMGAKRPQHKAWNFVVLAFWAVLILPAAEALLLHPGQRPSFGGARGWFLWLPIVLGLASYLPTRFWLAALCVGSGQVVALSPHLALLGRPLVSGATVAGYMLVACGLVAAWCIGCWRHAAPDPLNRQWIDFRDAFGLFWALRVQERISALASQHGWNIQLHWDGFHSGSANEDTAVGSPDAVASSAAFRGLLRRFVGPQWLASRNENAAGR